MMRISSLFALLALCLPFAVAEADPLCGSNDPNAPCTGVSHSRTIDGVTFTWNYTCNGGPCQHGVFLDGTIWVRNPTGGNVTIVSVTPDDDVSGLEKNPGNAQFQQGLYAVSGPDQTYVASRDLSKQLPYQAAPDNGVYVKAQGGNLCSYGAVGNNVIETYDAITVVQSVPNDGANGANTFRPWMSGSSKLFVTKDEIDLSVIPSFEDIPNGNYSTTIARWASPFPDFYGGLSGDLGQRWTPCARNRIGLMDEYADYRAEQNSSDLFGLLGTDAWTEAKLKALYALVQYGMDLYGSNILEGVESTAGAGQGQGRWHPVVLFGTVYNGPQSTTVKNNIKNHAAKIATFNDGSEVNFTELYQIRPNVNGIAIWGSFPGHDGCRQGGFSGFGRYWVEYSRKVDGEGETKRTCGDPYGYIDGPGRPGDHYASCCSSGFYVNLGLLLKIWPEFRAVANHPYMEQYAERLMNGAGWWTAGDQCVARDPREPSGCRPWTPAEALSTCASSSGQLLYFGKTWGHDLVRNDGTCITIDEAAAAGHPSPGPRWPNMHLNGRPNLPHCNPGCQLWDTLLGNMGSGKSATGTIEDDD